ncbi:uncharacterized protein LOC134286791 [Aedes albopictus]|uniref:Zinc finger PHD-type domain-containing protein n=1 Tax=Aedes albopictus TaxID=7160 RepID=A0ABM1YYR8_AEDAL
MADPNTEDLNVIKTPCAVCGGASIENAQMIKCSGCQLWFHVRCVGMSSGGELEKNWFCINDQCQRVKRNEVVNRATKDNDESNRSSVKSGAVLSLEQKLKAMEESKMQMEQELEAEMILKRKESEIKRSIKNKRIMLERKLNEEEEHQCILLQEEILRQRREQLNRMKVSQRLFVDEKENLDKELRKLKNFGMTSRIVIESDDGSDTEAECDENDCKGEAGVFSSRNRSNKVKPVKLGQHGLGRSRSGPTKLQLAARSGLNKKLPSFSGHPEEWPLFYGSFCASNDACGYSDVENLVRLQKCLTGEALEMVRGQLLLPKSVPRVIEKLRQLYGRPELLLKCHLEKVQNLMPPKPDSLASFIPFGSAVEQMCEHLEAADMKEHLINPLLIQELVDKLPDNDKRGWVRFKRRSRKVTLLSEACEANVSLSNNSGSRDVVPVIPVPKYRYYRPILGTENTGTGPPPVPVLSVLEN